MTAISILAAIVCIALSLYWRRRARQAERQLREWQAPR